MYIKFQFTNKTNYEMKVSVFFNKMSSSHYYTFCSRTFPEVCERIANGLPTVSTREHVSSLQFTSDDIYCALSACNN